MDHDQVQTRDMPVLRLMRTADVAAPRGGFPRSPPRRGADSGAAAACRARASVDEWQDAFIAKPRATFFHGPAWSLAWQDHTAGALRASPRRVALTRGRVALLGVTEERGRLGCTVNHLSPAGTYGGWVSRHQLEPEDLTVPTSAIEGLGTFIWRAPARPPSTTGVSGRDADLTHVIDLRQGANGAHRAWSDAARRRVRRAERAGAVVVEARGDRDWDAYDRLYRASLERWGERASSAYDVGLFVAIRARGGKDVRLWLVKAGDEVVAGALVLTAGRHAAYWHGASDTARVPGAANLLHWEIISVLAGEGAAVYDLGPSGGHAGVMRFKATLGAVHRRGAAPGPGAPTRGPRPQGATRRGPARGAARGRFDGIVPPVTAASPVAPEGPPEETSPATSAKGASRVTLSGRIAANSVVQILGNGLASFISLFTFAAMTRALGPSNFGDYAAAAAFLGIPLLLGDLGLSWTVLREISKHPARRDHVMGVSIVVRCLAAATILVVAVVIGLLMPFNDQVHYAIAVGALGTFFNLADLSLMPALQAELRMQQIVVMTVVSRLLTLGLVLALIAADYGFYAIVWAYAAGSGANLLLDVLVVRRLVGIRLIFDLQYGWTLLRGSLLVGIAYAAGTAYWYADRVLLSLLGSSTDVGLYGAAFKYVELSFIPISAISLSIFPVLTRAIAESEGRRVPHLLQWGIDIMLLASVPVCAFTLVYASGLIHVVGDRRFHAASALQVLGFLIVAFFVSSVFERALIAGHRERLLGALNGVILVVNIALNVISYLRTAIWP